MKKETRSLTAQVKTDGKRMVGLAAPFNRATTLTDVNGNDYREIIHPSAIKPRSNVWALWNHDDGKPIASNEARTLDLGFNADGLTFSLDIPEVSYAQDAKALLARNEPLGVSIGFFITEEKWSQRDGMAQREFDQSTSDQQTAEGNFKAARDAVRIFGKSDAEVDQLLAAKEKEILQV